MTCFLGIRSAKAPPNNDSTVNGTAIAMVTMARANGESLDNRNTSQLLQMICMFRARKAMRVPDNNHLKFRYLKDSNMA
jgi:hypothetical protein